MTDERIALVVRRLASTLPPNRVVQDPERLASYESDWTRRYRGRAGLVVLPETTEEVSLVMRTCHELQVPVVPQGGNTGLVGGGVPRSGEVVVSLSRMQGVEPVDAASGQVTVEAGVTLSSLQQHVRARGFDVGIDFAARDSATLGGIAATDAGGERVVRYGKARRHIAGLEAVLASGEVITRLTGLPKDNVGYDLRHLLVGSEGTLGVITRLRIQLTPLVPCRATALLAVGSLEDAVAVTSRVRHELETLESVELFFDEGLDLVCRHVGLPAPMPERHDVYLLIECADRRDPTEQLLRVVESQPEVRDAVVAMDANDRARLWVYRESHTEAINAVGVPIKLDVSIPLTGLAHFERRLRKLCATCFPGLRLVLFGHLAEGNLHVNLVGKSDESAETVVGDVLRLVADCDGSIGAEHGIGQAKSEWIHLSRSDSEIAMMRAIKQALDPRGVLNPGVLFPSTGSRDSDALD